MSVFRKWAKVPVEVGGIDQEFGIDHLQKYAKLVKGMQKRAQLVKNVCRWDWLWEWVGLVKSVGGTGRNRSRVPTGADRIGHECL